MYKKIDTDGRGFIDREMLRLYAITVRSYVYPGTDFDELNFEKGFLNLDRDNDGKITVDDIIFHVAKIISQ